MPWLYLVFAIIAEVIGTTALKASEGFTRPGAVAGVKWSCLLGQVCGLAKMHLVCVHAAFSVSTLPKYAMSGVRLSRAV